MANWKEINSSFTEELTQNWQKQGFDFEQVKKWIGIGFEPNDYQVASFARGNLGYNAENHLTSAEIENLRSIYHHDFDNQSILLNENFSDQAAIISSFFPQKENDSSSKENWQLWEEDLIREREKKNDSDMGWLTDDNIEYILKNDETIKKSDVQIRTDIANVYLQIEKAKNGEIVDNRFWSSLDMDKKYIILPLRVRGNHWSILFFINSRKNKRTLWIRYISSHPSPNEIPEEVRELEGFLGQVLKKYGNNTFNDESLKKIVLWNVPKQRNTWDCGVYLVKFINFLSNNDYHDLKDLEITDQTIKEFREEWKKRIGENKWCKWDATFVSTEIITERSESLKEKIAIQEDKDDSLWKKETENKVTELKTDLQKLTIVVCYFFTELKKTQEKNELLEKKQELLQKEIFQLKSVNLINNIQKREQELNKIISDTNSQLEDKELLEEIFEAQQEFILNNSSFALKQFRKYKNNLAKKGISEEKIEKMCKMKEELVKSEKEIRQIKLEAKIEI